MKHSFALLSLNFLLVASLSVGIFRPSVAIAAETSGQETGQCNEAKQIQKAVLSYARAHHGSLEYLGIGLAATGCLTAAAGELAQALSTLPPPERGFLYRGAAQVPAQLLEKEAIEAGERAALEKLGTRLIVGGTVTAAAGIIVIAPKLFMSGDRPTHLKAVELAENKNQFIGLALAKPDEFCKKLREEPRPMRNATVRYLEEMRTADERIHAVALQLNKYDRGELPALGFGAMASDATQVSLPQKAGTFR